MRFIDPFDFFQVRDPSQVDAAFLQRLRRKMLAEFELSEDGFLDWKGRAISKTETLNLLDEFEDAEKRRLYVEVRGIRGLADYLTENDPKLILKIRLDAFKTLAQKNPGLHAFCSPFVAETFSHQLGAAMEGRQWEVATILLKHVDLMRVEDLDAAFKLAIRHVRARILVLEDAALMEFHELKAFDYAPFILQEFLRVLNVFPSHFQQLRNAYSIALRKFAVALSEHKKLLADAVKVIEEAVTLLVDPHILRENRLYLQHILMKKVLAFEMPPMPNSGQAQGQAGGDREKERRNRVGQNIFGLIVFAVIIGVFALIRSGGGGSSPHSFDLKVPPFKYTIPEFDFKPSYYVSPRGDMTFYDTLEAHHLKMPDLEGEVRRPQTGENPYANFFGMVPRPGDRTFEAPIRLVNRSRRDMVVFVETSVPSKITNTVYVRSGDVVEGIVMQAGIYDFAVYDGKDWLDSITTYEGIPMGGFKQDVRFVGQRALRNDPRNGRSGARTKSVIVLEHDAHAIIFSGDSLYMEGSGY
jgi:hypothetical protein